MEEPEDLYSRILQRLDRIQQMQADLNHEIADLRQSLQSLHPASAQEPEPVVSPVPVMHAVQPVSQPPQLPEPEYRPQSARLLNLEQYIGGNLLNKIGILIILIGIGVGLRYAIDHDLISPLVRIVMAYAAGATLVGFAVRLRSRYADFSAVLLSGGMATTYLATYFAHTLYQFWSRETAFCLMVLITLTTIWAAVRYRQEVIALIGLVGAYVVPVLLAGDNGNIVFLFTYMALINAGILALAFVTRWLTLHYATFGCTWLIVIGWLSQGYDPAVHAVPVMVFGWVFFLMFYATFVIHGLRRIFLARQPHLILLLVNAFFAYGLGYAILNGQPGGADWLGRFTLVHAALHLGIITLLRQRLHQEPTLMYVIAGLGLVFTTLAVPIQLEGGWIPLIWMAEALLLFFVGRRQQVPTLVWAANTLILLSSGALFWEWLAFYGQPTSALPFLHPVMMTTLLCVAGMGAILVVDRWYPAHPSPARGAAWYGWGIPLLLLLVFHSVVWLEITRCGDELLRATREVVLQPDGTESRIYDPTLEPMTKMWKHCFSLAFVAAATWLVLTQFWHKTLSIVLGLWALIALMAFFGEGLYLMEGLRKAFFHPSQPIIFPPHPGLIGIRYLAWALAAALIYVGVQAGYRQIREGIFQQEVKVILELAVFCAGLVLVSSELVWWMLSAGSTQPAKLGLSLLWTLYSLGVIAWGLRYHNKPLRITSICLIGLSLLKLMVYDLAHLSTLARTVMLVCIGIVLLITSFLYNKLRHTLETESDEPEESAR